MGFQLATTRAWRWMRRELCLRLTSAPEQSTGAIPRTETSERLPTAEGQLSEPMGLGLDATGNVFVADAGRHRILKIAPSTGTVETVAGTGVQGDGGDGGPATSALLNSPSAVAVDRSGNLFLGGHRESPHPQDRRIHGRDRDRGRHRR